MEKGVSMPDPTVLAASGASLSTLQHEPRRLSSEADKCNAELESLVMDNYRVFVENLTCSVQLRAEVGHSSFSSLAPLRTADASGKQNETHTSISC
jgi:hypothetical protein